MGGQFWPTPFTGSGGLGSGLFWLFIVDPILLVVARAVFEALTGVTTTTASTSEGSPTASTRVAPSQTVTISGEWQGVSDDEIWEDAEISFADGRIVMESPQANPYRDYAFPFEAVNWFSVDPADEAPPYRRVAERTGSEWVLHGSVNEGTFEDRWRFILPGSKDVMRVVHRLTEAGVRDASRPEGRRFIEGSN